MNKLKFLNLDNIAYDYNSSTLLYNLEGQILHVYCINLSCTPEYKIVAIALKCILYRNLFKKEYCIILAARKKNTWKPEAEKMRRANSFMIQLLSISHNIMSNNL